MTEKNCACCKLVKRLDQFSPHKTGIGGRYAYCRECTKIKSAERRAQNPEAHRIAAAKSAKKNWARKSAYMESWRSENREHIAAYGAARRGRDRELARARYAADPSKSYANTVKRRAMRLKAVPPWYDHEKVEEKYALAKRMTAETGIKHEVDHIYPLNSPILCGLHWHGNLQVITQSENRRKKNRVDESSLFMELI